MQPERYADLVTFLKRNNRPGFPVLFRNAEEREYLISFLNSSTSEDTGTDASSLEDLRRLVFECTKCTGVVERRPGYGSGENGIMIILHAPSMLAIGEKHEYRRTSFELLGKMMAAIDVELEKCFITSLVKCETDDSMSTPGGRFSRCEDILSREIQVVHPSTIIVMGEMIPLKRIIDDHSSISWYCLDHPIALIKNPDLKRKAWNTLKLVREHIHG